MTEKGKDYNHEAVAIHGVKATLLCRFTKERVR